MKEAKERGLVPEILRSPYCSGGCGDRSHQKSPCTWQTRGRSSEARVWGHTAHSHDARFTACPLCLSCHVTSNAGYRNKHCNQDYLATLEMLPLFQSSFNIRANRLEAPLWGFFIAIVVRDVSMREFLWQLLSSLSDSFNRCYVSLESLSQMLSVYEALCGH